MPFLSIVSSLRTGNETLEEGLLAQVGVVLLEVLLGGGDELDGNELEAGNRSMAGRCAENWITIPSLLKAADDVANESTLRRCQYAVAGTT